MALAYPPISGRLVGLVCLGLLLGAPLGAESGAPEPPAAPFSALGPTPAEGDGSTPERVSLGKMLFFDPRLSDSNAIACATCHNPALAWGDGLPKAMGNHERLLTRRTPTILNTGFAETWFWDGRADSLEAQAEAAIAGPSELALPEARLEQKLAAIRGYQAAFAAAYPGAPITSHTVARAIAAFERTIVAGPAPFDRWRAGDPRALSAAAIRGYTLFVGRGRCALCHSGWNFSDNGFHDTGVADDDLGRGSSFPDLVVLQHAFKTPTLREVDRRGPYLHNGSLATLEAVIAFYNRGGDVRRPSLAEEIRPLGLTLAEQSDLLSFLHSLSGDDAYVAVPVLPSF